MNTKLFFSIVLFSLVGPFSAGGEVTSQPNAAPKSITVPAEFKTCKKDADCRRVLVQCSCCEFDAINKAKIVSYAEMEKQCKEPAPPCDCQEPATKPACVDKVCKNVPAKTSSGSDVE